MIKPVDFENAQVVGDYEKLEVGTYKCKILKAEEQKANSGKEFLKLAIDIVEGENKDFYTRKFDRDTRDNKKWSGVLTIFALDFEGKTNRYFKTLVTSVEESNPNYKFDFSNIATLKDKKVGIVFREEDFLDLSGEVKSTVKPFRCCSYDKTEEQQIPKKKEVQKEPVFDNPFASVNNNDDLPF